MRRIGAAFAFCCFTALTVFAGEEPGLSRAASVLPGAARGKNTAADTFYALLGVNTGNLFLNFGARWGNQPFGGVTFETMAQNIYPAPK
jgi:glucokinase